MIDDLLEDADSRMGGAITALQADLDSFRTGRASPVLLDRLVIELYGSSLKLNQLAGVSVPEPQQLLIRPFDESTVPAIERAILKSNLGLTPNSDGRIIRLNIPPLTEERRRGLAKQVSQRVEEARIAIRNVRRDIQNDFRELETEKMVSEDEAKSAHENLQKLTNKFVASAESIGKKKESELLQL
ncbi:MAG: ribosome recycling factor [Cellvibrionaceae bacterium]|jgi:ribosome recycling factor